jgi:sulfopyruvate decarboxylase alpha subunit
MTTQVVDWSADVHRALSAAGVRQIAYVPDAGLTRLIARCEADTDMRDVLLSNEAEGIPMLAGAWLGGERGVLLMQSSGVGNVIAALSLVKACRFPFLSIVTMRGEWGEVNPWQVPMGTTSQAHLEAGGVIVYLVRDAADVGETVAAAAQLAFESQAAVAVLVSQRVIGAKAFTAVK